MRRNVQAIGTRDVELLLLLLLLMLLMLLMIVVRVAVELAALAVAVAAWLGTAAVGVLTVAVQHQVVTVHQFEFA